MGIKLGDYFKDTFNVFTEKEAEMIYEVAGYLDLEEQKDERMNDLNFKLIKEIKKKENKSESDWILLNYHSTISIIGELLVSESKSHISSEEAIRQIRECMKVNL